MGLISESRLASLSNDEITRYSRHLILPEVGMTGQMRLKAARVLLVGTGALGAPMALYLAAAGVGTIGLVDDDFVEISNLQRQVIHSTADLDRPKVASARDSILSMNPNVNVVMHNLRLDSGNALQIMADYDVIADGTDNFQTRYLLNDAAVLLGKPVVYGSIFQFEGQASVFDARHGPCYRCLFPSPPPPGSVPTCGEAGVMGILPGIIGTIQACEIIKLILGDASVLMGRLLLLDAWRMAFRELELAKDPACPICGEHPVIHELIDYDAFCGLKGDAGLKPVESITATELKKRIDSGEQLQLIDIREPHERAIFSFDGARAMPFGQLLRRLDEFTPSLDAIFICKAGQRSIFAIRALQDAGYTGKMLNLKDGSNAWARDVNTALPQY